MKLNQDHFWNHAAKGMGENPLECPICMKRIEALEAKVSNSPYKAITISVTASVLAAYIVDRLVKRGR